MLDSVTKQFKETFKPVTDLVAINAKAMETITLKNTELFSEMVSAGVSHAQGFTSYKDLSDFAESQKAFAEGVQGKFVEAAKETYAVVTDSTEKAGEVMKGAFSKAQETMKAAPKAAAKAAAK